MEPREPFSQSIDPNPYDVLDISPNTPTSEIPKAFAMAMKRKKYSADVIAKARRRLMNPNERIIADYLRPLLPKEICEYSREDFLASEESETNLKFLSEFDGLEEAIASVNQASGINIRVGSTLINFFENLNG